MSTFTVTATDAVNGQSATSSANFTVQTGTPVSFSMTGQNIHLLNQLDPAIANKFFNTPGASGRGSSPTSNPISDGFTTTPVLVYDSYAQFQLDITNKAITFPYQWVLYDTEDWTATPQNEIDDPWTYMGLFGQLAHANGFLAFMSPARDLGNDPTSKNPKKSGESNDQWYLRTNLAGAGSAHADAYIVQGQIDTPNVTAYDALFNGAKQQALAANPAIKVYSHLSTNYGTVAQMVAAYKSVVCDGMYMNATSGAIATVDSFFKSI